MSSPICFKFGKIQIKNNTMYYKDLFKDWSLDHLEDYSYCIPSRLYTSI